MGDTAHERADRPPGPRAALVTGGGSGIGAAIARRLARDGLTVVVTGRRVDALRAVAASLDAPGHAVEMDLADPASIAAGWERARAAVGGPLDVLVNNAGVARSAPVGLQELDGRDVDRLHLEVNFLGAARLTRLALPDLLASGRGRVVNVASSAGLHGYPYVASYCASKHALVGWSRAAAAELGRKGVTVNLVCPHYVDSPMTDASVARIVETTGRTPEQARAALAAQNPGGRLVTPDEVAEAVATLVAGDANDQLLELDGHPPAP